MEHSSKDRKIHGESNVWSTAQRTERSMVRAMCGAQLKDINKGFGDNVGFE